MSNQQQITEVHGPDHLVRALIALLSAMCLVVAGTIVVLLVETAPPIGLQEARSEPISLEQDKEDSAEARSEDSLAMSDATVGRD